MFAWVLGLGVFFLTLHTTNNSAGNGNAGVNVLFGSIFGLSRSEAVTAVVVAALIAAGMVAIARPMLFASIDYAVAAARGIPVRMLGYVFLALVGAAAAEASQAVGALLVTRSARRTRRDSSTPHHPAVLGVAALRWPCGR